VPDHLQDQLSRTLGSAYTVERELGGGGMSRVYVAEDTRLKRQVVVKVLSPELAADHRADLYALGCVAFEMLTGAPPFHGRPVHQLFAAHMTEVPVNVATQRRDVPTSLASLVMRCLEKDAAKRSQSAREFLETLDAVGSNASPATQRRSRVWPIALVSAVVAVATVIYLGVRARGSSPSVVSTDRSIAVLPFANSGNDSTQGYFAEGIADELTTTLAKIPGVHVASRSPAFATAKRSASAQDAGRTLKVSTVLEGSVRRSGTRLRITAQLTNVADGLAIWSDAFDQDAADVFTAQDELARRIAAALHDKLAVANAADASTLDRGTHDQEAYDLYLRGRYLWQRRGEGSLRNASTLFAQAIAKDAAFARAWAGLAMVQVVLPEYIAVAEDTLIDAGIRTARRAVALNPNEAEGHLSWRSFRRAARPRRARLLIRSMHGRSEGSAAGISPAWRTPSWATPRSRCQR